MKYLIALVATFSIYFVSAQTNNYAQQTAALIENLKNGFYEEAHNRFNYDLKRQISHDYLMQIWEELIEAHDSFESYSEPIIEQKDSMWGSSSVLKFLLVLTFDEHENIAGIFFRNPNPPYTPPAYVNTVNFTETKHHIAASGFRNEGMLSMPNSTVKVPLIIIIGGSGPTDMDGTTGQNKPYKDLAWSIASKGVAVYRYNKRLANIENIKKIQHLEKLGIDEEYVDDLVSVVNHFKKHPKIDSKNVIVMGHSLGGYILPYAAKQLNKSVKAYISLAGNYTPLHQVLPKQFVYLKNLVTDSISIAEYNKLLNKTLYTEQNLYKPNFDSTNLLPGITIAYLQDADKKRPQNNIKYIKNKPFLMLQGGRDYQVPTSEAALWKHDLEGSCCTSFHTFDAVNHLFIEGTGIPSPAEYAIAGNVPEYVPSYIVNWIKQLK